MLPLNEYILFGIINVIDPQNEANGTDTPQTDHQTRISLTNGTNVTTTQIPPKGAELPALHAQREEVNDNKLQHSSNSVTLKESHSEYKVFII